MKSRFLNKTIINKNQNKFGRIIILTGARQTGKTTLAQKSFPDYKYLSIEDPMLRGEYSKLTAAQWESLYPNAILDEVQKEPKLFDKYLHFGAYPALSDNSLTDNDKREWLNRVCP